MSELIQTTGARSTRLAALCNAPLQTCINGIGRTSASVSVCCQADLHQLAFGSQWHFGLLLLRCVPASRVCQWHFYPTPIPIEGKHAVDRSKLVHTAGHSICSSKQQESSQQQGKMLQGQPQSRHNHEELHVGVQVRNNSGAAWLFLRPGCLRLRPGAFRAQNFGPGGSTYQFDQCCHPAHPAHALYKSSWQLWQSLLPHRSIGARLGMAVSELVHTLATCMGVTPPSAKTAASKSGVLLLTPFKHT